LQLRWRGAPAPHDSKQIRDPNDQNAAGSQKQKLGSDQSNHGRGPLNALHGRAPAGSERSWHWGQKVGIKQRPERFSIIPSVTKKSLAFFIRGASESLKIG